MSRIDINRANEETLKKINGIGSKIAKIIMEYKKRHGDFHTLEELTNIDGIGKRKLAQIKSRLKIGE
jgi:competence ComEA-like helix-hairpin-helix protein